jgi:hypothetical protein
MLIALFPYSAIADRAGWNEPGQVPVHNDSGLLNINKDYFDMAAATGGDFYFWAPGEFAEAAGYLNVPISSEPIALAYADSDGPFIHSLDLPIDRALSQLTIFAGVQLFAELRILRPDGRSLEENPAGVSLQSFRHMRIVTLTDPEPGMWMIELSGSGSFELAARYLTDQDMEGIDLIDFSFVEVLGRPGHKGLFPLSRPPQIGAEEKCLTTVTGDIKMPSIELVSPTGEVLDAAVLEEAGHLEDEYLGVCRVPGQPFRVRVRGQDSEGWLFQRITTGLIRPVEASH